jgi:hypothetical protein
MEASTYFRNTRKRLENNVLAPMGLAISCRYYYPMMDRWLIVGQQNCNEDEQGYLFVVVDKGTTIPY